MDTFLAQVTKKIFLFALMKQINTIVCFTLAFFFISLPVAMLSTGLCG